MLASDVLAKAKKILNDDNVVYLDEEILGWLNDGRVQIVKDRPDAYTVRETVQLAAGTAQTLPSECLALIDVPRNMGDGSTPGNAITVMEKDKLDHWRPAWHSENANAVVKHFLANPLTPREYYVYPAQPVSGQGHVEQIVSKALPAVADDADIVLSDGWVNALVEFVCWRAHSKDADVSEAGKGAQHRANYQALVG